MMDQSDTRPASEMPEAPAFVDGQWEVSPDQLPVVSPWSGQVVGRMSVASPVDVDRAVKVAAGMVGALGPRSARAAVLDTAADLLARDRERLAGLIVAEAGKPIRTSRAEVDRAVQTFRFAAAEARTGVGEVVPLDAHPSGQDRIGFVHRQPAGVVAAITPFNFPLNLVAHKLAPAIAAGCPVLLKPAERTPLTAVALVELMLEAGVPARAVQILPGMGAEVGAALAAHPDIAVLTFTGSAPVGHRLQGDAAPGVRVLLELGSPAPVVVEREADLAHAAAACAAHGYSYAGQSCVSVQRVLVHEDVRTPFREHLLSHVAGLRLGDPAAETSDLSSVIDDDAGTRIGAWLDEARDGGATVLAGGRVEGRRISPTVVENVDQDSALWTDEVFGPVVAVRGFSGTTEAIRELNVGPDLIQAGVFTRDFDTAMTYVDGLHVGGVLVNEAPTFRVDQMPYGGVGTAGNTREGPRSTVEAYSLSKLVVLHPKTT